MLSSKRVICFIFILFLTIPISTPIAGDGIKISYTEELIRENWQLAYIKLENTSWEHMDLFLAFASMHRDTNFTVLIPLNSQPANVKSIEDTSDNVEKKWGFDEVKQHNKKQKEGIGKLTNRVGDIFTKGILFDPLLDEIGGLSSSASLSGADYYNFQRLVNQRNITVDLLAFNTSQNLRNYYKSLNASMPENDEQIIERYGNYYVLAVNAKTYIPIDDEKFKLLEEYCPKSLQQLEENLSKIEKVYVAEGRHYFYSEVDYLLYRSAYDEAYSNSKSKVIAENAKNNIKELFGGFYGLTETKGYLLSMDLKLNNNEAFFPLGTSPSWGRIALTKVLFSCPENMDIQFNKNAEESYFGSRHYYYWEFKDGAPDFDLSGKANSKVISFGNEIGWIKEVAYEHSMPLAIIISLTILFSIFYIAFFLRFAESNEKHRKYYALAMSVGSSVIFLLIGPILTVSLIFLVLMIQAKRKKTMRSRTTKTNTISRHVISFVLICTTLLPGPFFWKDQNRVCVWYLLLFLIMGILLPVMIITLLYILELSERTDGELKTGKETIHKPRMKKKTTISKLVR